MKSKRLIYCPIESYKERSTEYVSFSDGVYETCFKELEIEFRTVRPDYELRSIKKGIVVDVLDRTAWGHEQIETLISWMLEGEISPDGDVIYFEDFWTPGFEMIPYAQSVIYGADKSKHIPVYAFCHAQSTDPYDFTAPWAWWMRDMEKGWMKYLTGLIVASKEMIAQLEQGGWPTRNHYDNEEARSKVHVCGLAFNREALLRIVYAPQPPNYHVPVYKKEERKNIVVFSSRWDLEKDPMFFIQLAQSVIKERQDISFLVCTGANRLNSNSPGLLTALEESIANYYPNLHVLTGLRKSDYFQLLKRAKVQFNCANQDFISYSLLDAVANGCAPLYPDYLTFPDALNHNPKHLYKKRDLEDAKKKLYALLDGPQEDYAWVYNKYERSVARMVHAMGFDIDEEKRKWER